MHSPPDRTTSAASASIRSTKPDPTKRPDLPQVNSIILKEGPRSKREVVHYPVHSRNSGEFKSNKVGFRTRHKIGGAWQNEDAKSFTLEDDQEILEAVRFIAAACGRSIPDLAGSFVVVPVAQGLDAGSIQAGLNELGASGQMEVLTDLLKTMSRERGAAVELLRRVAADPDAFAGVAAMVNLGRYRQAMKKLVSLIDGPNKEQEFQTLLSENPWMFGSEYSEHLPQHRYLTRDTQQDFVLRRTTDNYIEIVEIKTPLEGQSPLRFDRSRRNYYAGPELSAAIGQAEKYIEELEADRHAILARDKLDTLKVRAKVIIGRDGDDDQKAALRRLNGHLHRIEVITFDQLAAIARRTIGHLRAMVTVGEEQATR